MNHRLARVAVAFTAALAACNGAWAQSTRQTVPLIVAAGRPLRIVLERRTVTKRVGQPVRGVLLDPVYAYDRIVAPKGTRVSGHIETILKATGGARTRAILGGDLTPPRLALVVFDALEFGDGRVVRIRTDAVSPTGREPGKIDRFKDNAIRSLPYHPTFAGKGSVFSASLVEPINFGDVIPPELAAPGSAPAPGAMLKARLMTLLNSSTSTQGLRVDAVLTEPVFTADKHLILPEGTALVGEVTFVKRARRFRRNGQLRFLFADVQAPDRASQPLKSSLVSVESSPISVDEEGGATLKNNKTRFAAPALATLALVGSLQSRIEYDTDGLGPELARGDGGSGAVGGFLGLSVAGMGVSMLGSTATTVIAGVGVARTIYSTTFARGREVSFPAGAILQLQLAPRPGGTP